MDGELRELRSNEAIRGLTIPLTFPCTCTIINLRVIYLKVNCLQSEVKPLCRKSLSEEKKN